VLRPVAARAAVPDDERRVTIQRVECRHSSLSPPWAFGLRP
jgi:hypothetical protein